MSDASKKSTREKAAAARAAAEASEKRRDRTVKIGLAAVVVVIVAGIIGATLFATRDSGNADAGNTPDAANAALPAGVTAESLGAPVGTVDTPVLDIYEDFQCPACAALEAAISPTIGELVAAGQLKVNYHPMNFLDKNLGNDSSTRAAAAFGCAVDAGATLEYHNLVFANQPQQEGVGYTQEQLKDFGVQAGIAGPALDTFNACVDAQTYADWPTLSNEAASLKGITATPTLYLNGEEVDRNNLTSVDDFRNLILGTGGTAPAGDASSPAPAPASP